MNILDELAERGKSIYKLNITYKNGSSVIEKQIEKLNLWARGAEMQLVKSDFEQ